MNNVIGKTTKVNDEYISRILLKRHENMSNQLISQVEAYSSKLYIHQGEDSKKIVLDINELFSHMINKVKVVNRRKYCQVLLDYCDLTQDWRYWGLWAEEEIRIGAGFDSPWLFYGFGRYLEEIGQLRESLKYHTDGIEYSISVGDETHLALNHIGAGTTLQRLEKHQKAEWHLQKAVEILSRLGNVYRQADALLNLGSLYDRMGKMNLSISKYQESMSLIYQIDHVFDRGRFLYSLGMAYVKASKLEEAEKTFNESKETSIINNNLHYLALTYFGISWLEYCKNNILQSRENIEEAITKFKKATESGLSVVNTSFAERQGLIFNLAGAAYSKNPDPNYEAALQYLQYAEAAYCNFDYPDKSVAEVLANKARTFKNSGNISQAIKAFIALLAEGKRLKSPLMIGDAAVHLVHIYYQKKSGVRDWFSLLNQLGFIGSICFLIRCNAQIISLLRKYKYLYKK